MLSRNLDKARAAYKQHNLQASRQAHNIENSQEKHKIEQGQYLKSLVYGGLDGIITTFAVVAGVAGASLSFGVVLILGFANLIADGLSMAIGDYLSTKAEKEFNKAERKREEWEVANYPEGEKQELIELYEEKGIENTDATQMVNIIAKYKKAWIDIMMVEELGILPSKESPLKNALVTFVSFSVFGFLPLLTYVVARFWSGLSQFTFIIACFLTGITLFVLGALKTRFIDRAWWSAGFEMLIVGGLAASVAYFIGDLLAWLA